ncbi:hypothetical protein ACFWY9_16070 [Amycolatopsis sp. NPDC059027]|uniref:hypothetical protein n=1 Tax=unclassified Amycolatopsis TaxID=2618356 RepID=UPI00366B671E
MVRTNAGFRWSLAIGAVVAALVPFTSSPAFGAEPGSTGPRVAAADKVCLKAYMQKRGWQGEQCAPAGRAATVGGAGQGLRMEALTMSVGGSGFCAAGYVQDSGWQPWACAAAGGHLTVGTAGKNKRLEAVSYRVQTGVLCGNSYVQNVGWNKNWYCGADGKTNAIGTTGQNKHMEAVSFQVCRSVKNC